MGLRREVIDVSSYLLGPNSEPALLCSPWQKYMLAQKCLENKIFWYCELTQGGQLSWRGTKRLFVEPLLFWVCSFLLYSFVF